RNVATVTLRVDDAIPRRLLDAADAPATRPEAALSNTRSTTASAAGDAGPADCHGAENATTRCDLCKLHAVQHELRRHSEGCRMATWPTYDQDCLHGSVHPPSHGGSCMAEFSGGNLVR
ncbi:unnamed protein product, partial [Scytosiphon promiscuus]